ncbi:MAG: mechanosensitive ion channel domain-containing protein [Rhodothermales bacterium]
MQDVVHTTDFLLRSVVTAGIVVLAALGLYALKTAIVRFVNVRQMHRLRGRFVYRIARVFTLIFIAFSLAYVWGFDQEKLWVFVTGFLGLVAIGFFAVWSLLSNIVAGLFLFLSDPFKINDEIELPEVELGGKVRDIRPLFVMLEEDGGHVTYVPNNVFFQKSFRRFNPETRAREKAEAAAREADTDAQAAD